MPMRTWDAHTVDDPTSAAKDGALFRFWVRMASYPGGKPATLARVLAPCVTVEDYRAALIDLARAERVKLS